MLIVLAGEGLFPGASLGQQLPLLAVPPLHTTVLEPDFYLEIDHVSRQSSEAQYRFCLYDLK